MRRLPAVGARPARCPPLADRAPPARRARASGACLETGASSAGLPVILRAMPSETAADLVLTGGRIFTADAAKTWAEAMAVRGGRIAAVGGDRDVRPLVGPGTRVIELRGRTVTPGFGDSHVHPPMAGLARIRCELHGLHGLDDYLAAVAAYTQRQPGCRMDHGWRLVAGGLPGRPAAAGGPRPGLPGPPDLPAQPRRPRRVGQPGRARPGRHLGRARPTPTMAGSPAIRTAPRPAPSTRGRWRSWSASSHRPRPTTSAGPRSRASGISTRWASPTGRTPG